MAETAVESYAAELGAAIEKVASEPQHAPKDAEEGWQQFATRVTGPERESESKEAAASTEQRDAANPETGERRADAKPGDAKVGADTKLADYGEPIEGNRHWETKFERKEDHDAYWGRVDKRAGVILDYVKKSPDSARIVAGAAVLNASLNKREHLFHTFARVLAEVPNPGEVYAHFAIEPNDRATLAAAQTWQQVRDYVHKVSKGYAPPKPVAKPVAPAVKREPIKAPHEVGGRGAPPADGALLAAKEGNFADFDKAMKQRYSRR